MKKEIFIYKFPFKLIKEGIKSIEVRQFKGFFTQISLEDTFCFRSGKQIINIEVTRILLFKNLFDLLSICNLKLINPFIQSVNSGLKYYSSYYSNLETPFIAIYFKK